MSSPNQTTMMPRGEIVMLHFDTRDVVVWWGPEDALVDRVAVRDGRMRTWPTSSACLSDALRAGCSGLSDLKIRETVLDFTPVQAWQRGMRVAGFASAALNLWNFADDVARSIDVSWSDRGSVADRCYERLFAMDKPSLAGFEGGPWRWTGQELRRLRQVLDEAVHVLRRAEP